MVIEFYMIVLVSEPFKLVIEELTGVPLWMLLSTEVILLVGSIVLWICMPEIIQCQEFPPCQNDQ